MGLIPGQATKIPHVSEPKNQNIKQKQYYNKFNKDFKNYPHQKKSLKKINKRLSFSLDDLRKKKRYHRPKEQHVQVYHL